MNFPRAHGDAVKASVIVSGIARSGTSILGMLVGSFEGMEYSFEPPLAQHLDWLLQEGLLGEELAVGLMRTYLAEDVMINFHLGRGYNLRPQDDSCAYNVKDRAEIERRVKTVNRTNEAVDLMERLGSRLAVKIVSAYSLLPVLGKHFKGARVVEIERNLSDVKASVVARGWFSGGGGLHSAYWPCGVRGQPYFVGDVGWDLLSDVQRAGVVVDVLGVLRERALSVLRDAGCPVLVVKYEDFLKRPLVVGRRVAGFVGVDFSELSYDVISRVEAHPTTTYT